MADGTKIEWTDATWNPITGCQVKSAGCKFCYAMKLAGTRMKHHWSREGLTVDTKNGPVWTGEVRFNEEWLTQPLHWSKPRMIFVCAHSDLFYEAVPDEWIDRVFAVMQQAPQHIYQVLTKRPDRMWDYLRQIDTEPHHETVRRLAKALPAVPCITPMTFPSPHIWLGTSVEDQANADERRRPMLQLSGLGWRTWASYEPALGPVDWTRWEFLDWLVSGGESDNDGKSARPHHPDWHRASRDFCGQHGIPYLFKQWGSFHPSNEHDPEAHDCQATPEAIHSSGRREFRPQEAFRLIWRKPGWAGMCRIGKKAAGRDLDGVTHDGFPQVSE